MIKFTLFILFMTVGSFSTASAIEANSIHRLIENVKGDQFKVRKKALKSWMTQCESWRESKTRALSRFDITIIFCGKPDCTTVSSDYLCTSIAKVVYKDKAKPLSFKERVAAIRGEQ